MNLVDECCIFIKFNESNTCSEFDQSKKLGAFDVLDNLNK